MPFHIEEVKSDVTVIDGDLPLTEAQLEKLVRVIAQRLEGKQKAAALAHQESAISRHVAPPLRVGD
jgi:hypothetical protein